MSFSVAWQSVAVLHCPAAFRSSLEHRETFYQRDHRGRNRYDKNAWKDKEDQRENQLDGCLRRHLFSLLSPLRAHSVRKSTQWPGDRRSKPFRLNQHIDERTDIFHIHTICHIAPSADARIASPLLEINLEERSEERR